MMSAVWTGEDLLGPTAAAPPCGRNPDNSPELARLLAASLFGQIRSPETQAEDKDSRKNPFDWGETRALALKTLADTRDLRALTYLGTTFLRTDEGLAGFLRTLVIAAGWLEAYWVDVHPQLDPEAVAARARVDAARAAVEELSRQNGNADADLLGAATRELTTAEAAFGRIELFLGKARQSALNCFADPMAVLERMRRVPLVQSRAGRFGLRDLEIAAGRIPGASGEKVEPARIEAAFAEADPQALTELRAATAQGLQALARIEQQMDQGAGYQSVPEFQPLRKLLQAIQAELDARQPAEEMPAASSDGGHAAAANGTGRASTAAEASHGGGAIGPIRTREDAAAALDAVAAFFQQTEPASPVPLFIERAKRLIGMDFLQVIDDVAPGAVTEVRHAAGIRNSQAE